MESRVSLYCIWPQEIESGSNDGSCRKGQHKEELSRNECLGLKDSEFSVIRVFNRG